jgi:PilZ domain-containing protein
MVTAVLCDTDTDNLVSADQTGGTTIQSSARLPGGTNLQSSATLMTTAPFVRNPVAKRRSRRMALNAAVGLSGQDRQKCSFTMPARATNLNRYGAAIQLNRDLLVGSIVIVRNKRGTRVSARVVAQINAVEGIRTYGIEFREQDDRATNFWGITFPTA